MRLNRNASNASYPQLSGSLAARTDDDVRDPGNHPHSGRQLSQNCDVSPVAARAAQREMKREGPIRTEYTLSPAYCGTREGHIGDVPGNGDLESLASYAVLPSGRACYLGTGDAIDSILGIYCNGPYRPRTEFEMTM